MGSVLTYFWGREPNDDPELDIPHPTTGLTPRERQAVVDTWAIMKQDAKRAGVELFIQLFEAHPEYQKLFRVFESLSLQELEKSAKLSAHATNVMYSLTSVIDNLEDPECLTELLIKLGQNHDRHGVSEKEFNDLKVVLMKLLKQKLGKKLTSQAEAAWSKTIDVAYQVIFEGLKTSDVASVK
ncbi:globin-like [Zootermopsis nevadensis]|uniref:Globin n=1 Tax=Zootermopsis nevadensis TaxID=136037 RepID=A0A067RER1_ZOONE|nr:globin-like [Zootermopsis nevadensis]KDR21528.1 Globin [Zootermopsis nevadensis]